jgi:hypothetical protein
MLYTLYILLPSMLMKVVIYGDSEFLSGSLFICHGNPDNNFESSCIYLTCIQDASISIPGRNVFFRDFVLGEYFDS